jgi:hypothetical protein
MCEKKEYRYQQVQRIIVFQSTPHHSSPSPSLAFLLVDEFPQPMHIGIWTQNETEKLVSAVKIYGSNHCEKCSDFIGTRTPKQCRDKWLYSFQPDLNKSAFQDWEDRIIIHLQKLIGNRWSKIANSLPGRTPSSVKNRWYSRLSKEQNPRWKLK